MATALALPRPALAPVTSGTPRDVLRAERDARWDGLLAAAQGGDARAYAALLRDVAPFLRAVVGRRIADPTEAEDAVQDALLTIHQLRHAYDPARPARPWLAAIAERRAIDRLRRRGRTAGREAVTLDDLPEAAAATPAGAEEHLAARELRAAVAELPDSQRTALRLAKLDGLSLAEASLRSGLSVGALKIATHRALSTLRRRLGAGIGS